MSSPNETLETELRELIVTALDLTDVKSDAIDSDAPLFGSGLELDSIDALELAVAISERYGVEVSDESEDAKEIFRSVRSLAAYIALRTARK